MQIIGLYLKRNRFTDIFLLIILLKRRFRFQEELVMDILNIAGQYLAPIAVMGGVIKRKKVIKNKNRKDFLATFAVLPFATFAVKKTYYFLILSTLLPMLSCIFFVTLSAVFTASVSGESAETESFEVVVVSSLLLLQAAKKDTTATMANNFFILYF